MGLIAEIASVVPKALGTAEEAIFSPKSFFKREIDASEAYVLLTVSFALSVVILICISLTYLAIFEPAQLGSHADESTAIFTGQLVTGGATIIVGLITATLGSVWAAFVARLSGTSSASAVFPKLLAIFSLEWLAAIPMGFLLIDKQLVWPWLLFFIIRLAELAAFAFAFRVGCDLTPGRAAIATIFGGVPAVAIAFASHILTLTLVATFMLGWD